MKSLIHSSSLKTAAGAVLLVGTISFAQQTERNPSSNTQNQKSEAAQNEATRDPARNPQRDAARDPAAQGRTERQGQPARANAENRAEHADGQLAACLIIDNNMEVALAQLAEQQSRNQQVQEFARQIAEDHGQFVTQLQEAAQRGGYMPQELALRASQSPGQERNSTEQRTRPADPGQARDSDTPSPRRTARPAELDQAHGALDFISIKQEVAERCLQTAREQLTKKSEAEFDKCYVGLQVMAHRAMIDQLEVFARHASPELRTTIENGLKVTREHLTQAEELENQLAGNANAPRNRETN